MRWNYAIEKNQWVIEGGQAEPPPRPAKIDARQLEEMLRADIEGEVRFDDGSRALYATDGSNYRMVPIGVVVPKTIEDVVRTVARCRKSGAPLLSRGCGTSLAGQSCNVAVVIDFSKYLNHVLGIDTEKKLARVMPGTILDDLRKQAERFHLTFGPDPATHTHCTLGGMIGNDSCGIHAQMAGRTSDNIESLEVLTYDGHRMGVRGTNDLELARTIREGGRKGEIYAKLKQLIDRYGDEVRRRFPKIPRLVSGYNLAALLPENGFNVARALVGSESTLVTVLEATVKLVPSPPARTLVILGYPDVYSAGDHIPQIGGFKPIGLEGIDDRLVDFTVKKGLHPDARSLLPEGDGWLIVEFGADTQEEADAKADRMLAFLRVRKNPPTVKFVDDKEHEDKIWSIRESGLGATARAPGQKDTWEGWEDSAVPPERVGPYLRDLRSLLERYGLECALYGHFGQGCIHTRIDFDLITEPGVKKFRAFLEDASDLVVRYGGSLSGEHGDGQSRAEFLPKMFGPELMQAFREFKAIWDPDWKMNPGKVVNAYRIDENLRLGSQYHPAQPTTQFTFPDDKGSLAYASLRCVGVGKCRRLDGGTMCPSFMATREERHSTRGRAHLFHEMLSGDVIQKYGWNNRAVKEALDLCLSCKGCKSDCPVNVDMATYKAEFLSHYFQSNRRPITAYSMGLINVWAEIGAAFPGLVNFVTQTPVLRSIAKALAGIDQRRQIPRFASRTFRNWFVTRASRNVGAPKVLLWADTFNNHFHPETATAAVEVLEDAGFQVLVPKQKLCCGRPLYDYGMLNLARAYLRRILIALRREIDEGIPVVVLEPSCFSVFKDELRNLLPNDHDAVRLSDQTYLLAEFLEKLAPHYDVPKARGKALLHLHCHQKAIGKPSIDYALFHKMAIEYRIPEPGCCGMAGSFGFEKECERYDVAMKIGEKTLLPATRETDGELIIADGFSCREQILQGSGKRPLHTAEVLRDAIAQRKQLS